MNWVPPMTRTFNSAPSEAGSVSGSAFADEPGDAHQAAADDDHDDDAGDEVGDDHERGADAHRHHSAGFFAVHAHRHADGPEQQRDHDQVDVHYPDHRRD